MSLKSIVKDSKKMDEKNQKDIANLSPKDIVFYSNHNLLFFFEKIKKIALASYLVTDLTKDTEALKSQVRGVAGELIKDIILGEREANFKDRIQAKLLLLKTYFDIGRASKIFSKMNAEIISEEISKLAVSIHKDTESSSILSEQSFFDSGESIAGYKKVDLKDIYPLSDFLGSKEEFDSGNDSYKGHNKRHDNNVLYNNRQTKYANLSKDIYKRQSKNISTNQHEDRESRILSIIKDKKEVTIKDISSSIKDCSEKTIQRDLINMLSKNIIKKTGERRWSKYSII